MSKRKRKDEDEDHSALTLDDIKKRIADKQATLETLQDEIAELHQLRYTHPEVVAEIIDKLVGGVLHTCKVRQKPDEKRKSLLRQMLAGKLQRLVIYRETGSKECDEYDHPYTVWWTWKGHKYAILMPDNGGQPAAFLEHPDLSATASETTKKKLSAVAERHIEFACENKSRPPTEDEAVKQLQAVEKKEPYCLVLTFLAFYPCIENGVMPCPNTYDDCSVEASSTENKEEEDDDEE